jgi:hypothetical protein
VRLGIVVWDICIFSRASQNSPRTAVGTALGYTSSMKNDR